MGVSRNWGMEKRELVFNGDRAVWEDEKVVEMDGGDGYTAMCMYLMPLNCALKNGKFYVMQV